MQKYYKITYSARVITVNTNLFQDVASYCLNPVKCPEYSRIFNKIAPVLALRKRKEGEKALKKITKKGKGP